MKFLQKRTKLSPGDLEYLKNIQEIINSLECKPSLDPLEKITTFPLCEGSGNQDEQEETDEEEIDAVTALMAQLDARNSESPHVTDANSQQHTIFDSQHLRDQGPNSSGHELLQEVKVQKKQQLHFTRTSEEEEVNNTQSVPVSEMRGKVYQESLTTLAAKSMLKGNNSLEDAIMKEEVEATGSAKSIINFGKSRHLDKKQQRAFEVLTATFMLSYYKEALFSRAGQRTTDPLVQPRKRQRLSRAHFNRCKRDLEKLAGRQGQLVMFLTGPGGAGKSHIIESVTTYAKEFSTNLNTPYDRRTIIITAYTGVAALSIHGETTSSASGMGQGNVSDDQINQWRNARLLIVDEVSFLNESELEALHKRLNLLTETNDLTKPYGNLNVCFCGDFCQLEPVGAGTLALYKATGCGLWHNCMNCFIELEGMHRFKDDKAWGELLWRFRIGCPTREDFKTINARVLRAGDDAELPLGTQSATHSNMERCAINAGIFSKHLQKTHSKNRRDPIPKHTLVIKADEMVYATKGGGDGADHAVGPKTRHHIYSTCAVKDVKTASGRPKMVDVLIKLYFGCPFMLTENKGCCKWKSKWNSLHT